MHTVYALLLFANCVISQQSLLGDNLSNSFDASHADYSSLFSENSNIRPLISPEDLVVATVLSAEKQTFTGIGGSGAWWPYDIYKFPESIRQNVSRLLFAPSGLGLTSYRWNVGGGGVNVTDPIRAPTTFYVGPKTYDWSADAEGVYFLKEAARYKVPHIAAFVNSAPPPFTSSGGSCNGTFITGKEDAYGEYIADVIAHWREEGVGINLVSPMNEPDGNFPDCRQEGMEVKVEQRAAVIRGVYDALVEHGLQDAVGIIADESNSTNIAIDHYEKWLTKDVANMITAFVHHTYNFPNDGAYAEYINMAQAIVPSKPTRMSEICCSIGRADASDAHFSQGYDPTITGGLHFASLMFQSFIVASQAHYDFWTLVSDKMGCSPFDNDTCATTANANGWQDGLIYYDPKYASNGNHELYLTKHYWTMKHMTNFITPGSVRHEVLSASSQARTLAVYTPTEIRIISINPTTAPLAFLVLFERGAGLDLVAKVAYRTSGTEDWGAPELPAKLANGAWMMSLASNSLTSFIFSRN
ncbi:glycoside hydrolase family 30 protein [Botryobasidium botryosum FD-172 SS1]|uniref:Glycoside hydrolase family 30 protein n=1 Tax=Botryobasidium botryosum (strain FD-172 SS1) TaxID=930990 RepID=A0A067MQ13_BOTB1|nr:glycoside hydrolase family 30 protein [Botryobasidium botryosum FD-172 SS1]